MKFIETDRVGVVDGFGLVKSVEKKSAKNGTFYLDMLLGDKDGDVYAKVWDFREEVTPIPAANSIIKFRGNLQQYNGNDQLIIQKMRPAGVEDNVNMNDFVKSADIDGSDMYRAIVNVVSAFSDTELKNVVLGMLSDNRENMVSFPAAEKLHHAMRGGLLYHTLSIVRLAESVCAIYPFVDRELLLSGAILHDIAKIREYSLSPAGVVDGHTLEGMLLGHLVMGAEDVGRKCDELGISSEKKYLLQHMLISHHGKLEFGAAVRPAFIEAELLSQLDLLDANIYEMADAVKDTAKGDFTGRLWMLDNRRLYNHGRTEVEPKAEIL
jgi:3'-5' exoribonuclease